MSIQSLAIVGGCGHIGLPLGLLCARAGIQTLLVDCDADKVALVNSGQMPFREKGAPLLLRKLVESRKISAGSDMSAISAVDVILLTTMGTYANADMRIQSSDLFKVVEEMAPYLTKKQTLILRSTLAPGTSAKIQALLKQKKCEVSLAYCPERILQGEALKEIETLPQIISGFEQKGIVQSKELFSRISRGALIELSVMEAELAKIFSNTWRYINFSISNQFWEITNQFGANFTKIHEALTYEYPRMSQFARAGFVGGSCLKKDTLQLAALLKNHDSFLGKNAILINDGLPHLVMGQVKERFGDIQGLKVGILGGAFKKDSDDLRNSPSLDLRDLFLEHGAEVLIHDPFVTSHGQLTLSPLAEVLSCPCVVLAAPHSQYQDLSFKDHQLVIDLWGLWERAENIQAKEVLP